jgi:ATP-dependent exoDNAse (exonuclease V) beta subunit
MRKTKKNKTEDEFPPELVNLLIPKINEEDTNLPNQFHHNNPKAKKAWENLLFQVAEDKAKAARLMEDQPSRSILALSAAILYTGLERWNEASQITTIGLSGKEIPDEIAKELKDILKECKKHTDAALEFNKKFKKEEPKKSPF